LEALDAVTSIEALDDGRHRVTVMGPDGPAAYVVTLERVVNPAPTPLTCKGNEGASYPSFDLVELVAE
ncbi:MAG: hypothetical protein ABW122_15345, partial [Ilumatobacteraceae bacterium]